MESTLTCPKCGSDMRSYERNGVVVDQCTGCGGLFLDRGELERLAAAESAHYGAPSGADPEERDRDHERGREEQRPKRKKRSFLEELFE